MSDPGSPQGHGPPSAILSWSRAGADLAGRRSQALTDYWSGMTHAHRPQEVMAVQIDYWTHWVEDYAKAAAEAFAPFAPPSGGPIRH